ncbi:hemolysin family protein [Lentisphaerota bacterium WC36G]|nr:hemolysin family protein [Lentisphaerae bacterium WC36]
MIIAELILFLVLIFLSGLFSSSETALFALSRARLLEYKNSANKVKKTIAILMNSYETTLIAIILGNTFVNVGLTVLSESLLDYFTLPLWVVTALSAIISVVALLLFGEVIPKSMALANSVKFAHFTAFFIYYFKLIFTPTIWLLNVVCNAGVNLLGRIKNQALSYEEHGEFISFAVEKGAFSFEEGNFIKKLLFFQEQKVSGIMESRVDIKTVFEDAEISDIMPIISRSKQLFIPICKNDIDDCEKIIVSKKFFLLDKVVKLDYIHSEAVIAAKFLPETVNLSIALKFLQDNNIEVALLTDEYGRVSGMISLENIYENILGDIVDEHEDSSVFVQNIADNRWFICGIAPTTFLSSLSKNEVILNRISKDLEAYEATTLSGLFAEYLQRLPLLGDEIYIGEYLLRVEQLDHKRVVKIYVKFVEETSEAEL